MKKIVPYFSETSAFLKADSRTNRWAIPYNYECLNSRVDVLLGGNEDAIKGKRVLDIGSHIGTFSYAALKMGADFVHGVDTDEALIFKSNDLFETQGILSLNYKFEARDLFDYLENLEPNSFDTILCFGILYYTADPYYVLHLLRRAAKECVLLDTFTAYYAALQGKDAEEIYPHVKDKTMELPMMLVSLTQPGKNDYRLPRSFIYKDKSLSLTSYPTQTLLEIWLHTLNTRFIPLDWSPYIEKPVKWRKLRTQKQKENSHWSDVYSSGVRVSYRLDIPPEKEK